MKADYELTKASLTTVLGRTTFLATFQTFLNAHPCKPQEPLEVYAAELTNLVKRFLNMMQQHGIAKFLVDL